MRKLIQRSAVLLGGTRRVENASSEVLLYSQLASTTDPAESANVCITAMMRGASGA
jgi:hypothetical protein